MLRTSSSLSFSKFYATTTLESIGDSVLVIPHFLKIKSYVAEVYPIHTFGSLNIFSSSVNFISLLSFTIISSYKIDKMAVFSTSDFLRHDLQLTGFFLDFSSLSKSLWTHVYFCHTCYSLQLNWSISYCLYYLNLIHCICWICGLSLHI